MPRTGKRKAPQSEEAAAWFYLVYTAIQQIPYGKVTSYGHIAYLVGHRKSLQPFRFIPLAFSRASHTLLTGG